MAWPGIAKHDLLAADPLVPAGSMSGVWVQ